MYNCRYCANKCKDVYADKWIDKQCDFFDIIRLCDTCSNLATKTMMRDGESVEIPVCSKGRDLYIVPFTDTRTCTNNVYTSKDISDYGGSYEILLRQDMLAISERKECWERKGYCESDVHES